MLIPTSGLTQLTIGKNITKTLVESIPTDNRSSMYGKMVTPIKNKGSFTFTVDKGIFVILFLDKKITIKAIINTPAMTQPRL